MTTLFDFLDGRIDREQLARFVRSRDKRLRPEVDSSQLNYFLLDVLLAEFPKAKFILTIRDCYSWLDSFINHQLARKSDPLWDRLRDLRFRPAEFKHSDEEKVLRENGLYTLDGYLSYWANHNSTALQKIPSERLLVVRTNEITQRTRDIAAFAGIEVTKISIEKSHSFKAAARFNVLAKIPAVFVEEKVSLHCRRLMDQYFPAIKTALDILPQIDSQAVRPARLAF